MLRTVSLILLAALALGAAHPAHCALTPATGGAAGAAAHEGAGTHDRRTTAARPAAAKDLAHRDHRGTHQTSAGHAHTPPGPASPATDVAGAPDAEPRDGSHAGTHGAATDCPTLAVCGAAALPGPGALVRAPSGGLSAQPRSTVSAPGVADLATEPPPPRAS